MSWSSVVAERGDESRGQPAAAQNGEGHVHAVDRKAVDRRAGVVPAQNRRGVGGRGSGRGSNRRPPAKTHGRRGNERREGTDAGGAGNADSAPAKLKPKAVFAAAPANAWGRATETKERLGVPSSVKVEVGGYVREDEAEGPVVAYELDSGEQAAGERPGVQAPALAPMKGPHHGTATVVDLEAARASFAALAGGVSGLTDDVAVEPVGMENPGNVCFANAVVQALLGCDLFRCLMHRITVAGPALDASVGEYPVLKALADIGRELIFRPAIRGVAGAVEAANGVVRAAEGAMETAGPAGSAGCASRQERRRLARPINVELITRLVHESFSTRYKGEQRTRQIEQEDAHEFLHCLLDGMHQEFLRIADDGAVDAAGDVVEEANGHRVDSSVDMAGLRIGDSAGADGNDGEWLTQSGKRAVKQQVVTAELPTAARRRTAVSELFEGMLATSISSRGNPPSITMHPFLVVEIPLYDTSIDTLEAAISGVMAIETISGYRPAGGTGAACEASKSERFQALPEVLILHFMRFQFTGSSEKLNKIVRYGTTLRVKAGWMMAGAKDRRTEYQLVSTISHHGDSIARGHFTANVRHGSDDPAGVDSDWVNLNDECVRPVREDRVLYDTPYMLFYRRVTAS